MDTCQPKRLCSMAMDLLQGCIMQECPTKVKGPHPCIWFLVYCLCMNVCARLLALSLVARRQQNHSCNAGHQGLGYSASQVAKAYKS